MRLFTSFFFSLTLLILCASSAYATTYYLSPTGNDTTGNGSYNSPWKGINKANNVVQAGDTVIFKDGIYNMYDPAAKTIILSTITKSGTTWKAENKHKAVIDGGMGPELFAANPQNAAAIYKAKMPYVKPDEFWINMVLVSGASNITIDGLVFANSPGRGLTIYQGSHDKTIENITIKNTWFDFNWENPFLVQSVAKADYSKVKNITYENGLTTRAARQMLCKIYDGQFCTNWPGVHRPSGSSNIVTKNSVFAYNYGEIGPDHGATFDLFENNVVIHSFISYYADTVQNVTVRNNLMVASDSLRVGGVPGLFENPTGPTSTRETHMQGVSDNFPNKNFHVYNNVLVGLPIGIYGDFKNAPYPLEGLYLGHNTIIGTNKTRSWSSLTGTFIDITGFTSGNPVRGIVENNLFITEQMPSKSNVVRILPSGWEAIGRNNLVPQSQAGTLLHTADAIKSDVSGVVNPQAVFNLSTPIMFAHRDAFKAKVEQDVAYSREYVKNLHLKSTSLAVNSGSTGGTAKGLTPPTDARTRDFYGNARVGTPDIGAIEYNGTQVSGTPSPTPSTPASTPSPTPTSTPIPTSAVIPTPSVSGNILKNGDFSSGISNWNFAIYNTGSLSAENGTAKIQITSPGDNMQLYQPDISLQPGVKYRLSFKAKSDNGRGINGIYFHRHDKPYTLYASITDTPRSLSKEFQEYSYVFTPTGFGGVATDVRLRFWFVDNAKAKGTYWFDDVVLSVYTPNVREPKQDGAVNIFNWRNLFKWFSRSNRERDSRGFPRA